MTDNFYGNAFNLNYKISLSWASKDGTDLTEIFLWNLQYFLQGLALISLTIIYFISWVILETLH